MRGLAAYGVRGDSAAMGVQRDAGGDAMLATIRAQNADYAWYGGLGLADDGTWRDVMRGVVATSAARPTIGTLGGRRAAGFDGSQRLQTAAFASAIAQPCAILAVVQGLTSGGSQFLWDGVTGGRLTAGRSLTITGRIEAFASATISSASGYTPPAVGYVLTTVYNGASSEITVNSTQIASGNVGTGGLAGITIGSQAAGLYGFTGTIALLAIFSGANYAARAAAIATMARSWYGTG